ncbi:MAG: hypothetical protein AAFQ82_15185 [Myxococcota bacterium]
MRVGDPRVGAPSAEAEKKNDSPRPKTPAPQLQSGGVVEAPVSKLSTLARSLIEGPQPRSKASVAAVGDGASKGAFVRSLTWDGSNSVTSGGRTVEVELRGVPHGAQFLRGDGLHVTGLKPFVAGKGPDDSPDGTRTRRHDSFSQFVTATALRRHMDETDRVMGEGFFRSLIASRPGRTELRVLVNEGEYENAYYRSLSGTIALGTFNGEWSAADDQEVVLHECSHWDYDALVPGIQMGSMNEGRADVLAMIRNREPVIAEAWPGAKGALRRADGDARWSTTTPGHDRGRVVSGMFYDLAKVLQELYTGEPLSGGHIDQRVADDLERIYWTYPALQGTTRPDGPAFVNAMREAIVRLHRVAAFSPKFSRKTVLAALEESAKRRELDQSRADDAAGTIQAPVRTRMKTLAQSSWEDAALEGLEVHGLKPDAHRVEEIQRLDLPSGEELRRYRVVRSFGESEAVLTADALTLIRERDGAIRAQAGLLPANTD